MAPTLVTVGTALLACAGNAVAKKWYLDDTYDASNFFDKFDFFESRFDTGDLNDIDPTGGHVNYQNRKNAFDKGLVGYKNGDVYIGADTKTVLPGAFQPGRPSVRIESKARYNHGLLIARFTHLPENKCGTWPAVWTYGQDWPNDGEIDFYEEWNNSPWNQPALHTNNSPKYGQCILDGEGQTSGVLTDNCDNSFSNPPFQYNNQGCVSAETNGPWASENGGVYAMEWTSDYIKLFSWHWANVPANIDTSSPDTSTWGTPSVYLKNKHCDIDRHFSNQRLVLNINFCGIPPALPEIWGQSCAAETTVGNCVDYVSKHPGDFKDVYFQIKDIRYFVDTAPPASTSSSVAATSTSSRASTSTSSTASTSTSSRASTSTSSRASTSTSSRASTSTSSRASTSTSSRASTSTSSRASTSTSSRASTSTSSRASTSTSSRASTSSSTSSRISSSSASSRASTSSATSTSVASSSATSSSAISSAVSVSGTSTSSAASTSSASTSAAASISGTLGASSSSISSTVTGDVSVSASSTESVSESATSSDVSTSTSGLASTSSFDISTSSSSVVIPSSTLSPSSRWSNSSTSAVPVSSTTGALPGVTSTADLTTSTVFTTKVHTVTKCPPWVNCPVGGYVTTETIPLYTTVCPVTKATTTPTAKPTLPTGAETITTTISSVYTVTSCPPSVTNCPVGHVTTEIITTTYCPGAQETQPPAHGPETVTTTKVYTITGCPPSVPNCPIGSVTTEVVTTTAPAHPGQTGGHAVPTPEIPVPVIPSAFHPSLSSAIVPKPSGSHNGTIPSKPSPVPSHGGQQEGCTGAECPNLPSGAGKMGISALLVVGSALVAMMM